ncbi:MAG: hypothetical protein GF350_08295 [Chitinivibrionales bacterium]|nr:hypothetical protein [Chitinivibrionales bacterium]
MNIARCKIRISYKLRNKPQSSGGLMKASSITRALCLCILAAGNSGRVVAAVGFSDGPRGNIDAVIEANNVQSPTQYNHNVSNQPLPNGDALAAWSCGIEEGNHGLCMAKYINGQGWGPGREVVKKSDIGNRTIWAPSLFYSRKAGEPIYCFFANTLGGGKNYFITSSDNGETWSDVQSFPEPVQDLWNTWPAGALEIPPGTQSPFEAYTLLKPGANGKVRRGMHFVIPPDNRSGAQPGGTPWEATWVTDQYEGMNYGYLVLDPSGFTNLVMLVRSNTHSHFNIKHSTDGGQSWGPKLDTDAKAGFKGASGVKTGISGITLDLYGGPRQAENWHVVVGTAGYSGHGRDFIRIAATQNVDDKWTTVFEGGIGQGEQA